MKVRELVKLLETWNPELEVVFCADGQHAVEIVGVELVTMDRGLVVSIYAPEPVPVEERA